MGYGFATRAIHAGQRPDPETGARAMPIYATTSFVFEDAQTAADLFALQTYGNIYTRIGNPTNAAFEERMASLEGGLGSAGDRFRAGGAIDRHPDPLPGRGRDRRGPEPVRRHLYPVRRDPPTHGDRRHLRRSRRPRPSPPPSRPGPNSCTERRSATPGQRSSISRGPPRSPTSTAYPWSSTTRSQRLTCAGRSSGEPTSWSTRRPSSSAGTGWSLAA